MHTDHSELPDAVILAAGGGRRMGRAKGLLQLCGTPLLVHHIRALAPYSRRVIAALGAETQAHRDLLPPGVLVAENPDWATTWPADTLRIALIAHEVRGPCWVTLVDTPPPSADVLGGLLDAGPPAVPVDGNGRPGHPVLLDTAAVQSVRRVAPAGGLRTLLNSARRVQTSGPIGLDFDEPADWRLFTASG